MKRIFLALALCLCAFPALAWNMQFNPAFAFSEFADAAFKGAGYMIGVMTVIIPILVVLFLVGQWIKRP